MPVICDDPDWWAFEVLDGAPMHFIDPAVLKIYWDHRIMQPLRWPRRLLRSPP